jgi:hypothetical protein
MKQEDLFKMAMGLQDLWFIVRGEFRPTESLINEPHLYVGHKPKLRVDFSFIP